MFESMYYLWIILGFSFLLSSLFNQKILGRIVLAVFAVPFFSMLIFVSAEIETQSCNPIIHNITSIHTNITNGTQTIDSYSMENQCTITKHYKEENINFFLGMTLISVAWVFMASLLALAQWKELKRGDL